MEKKDLSVLTYLSVFKQFNNISKCCFNWKQSENKNLPEATPALNEHYQHHLCRQFSFQVIRSQACNNLIKLCAIH